MSTAPTNPLPTNPLPLFVDHAASVSASAAKPGSAASYDYQFYVKQGESVRTLGADQIRLEVASGSVRPDALICKVGDTGWRPLSDAAAIGLELPSLPPLPKVPVPSVAPAKAPSPAFDEPNPFARRGVGGLGAKLSQAKKNGTLIVWGVSLTVATVVVLGRNGTLYSAASGVGLADTYESLEKSLFGGPGEGTARSAERLLGEVVPAESMPFANVEARVTGKGKGEIKPAP